MLIMKQIYLRRKPCRRRRTRLFFSQVLKGTDKTAEHSLIRTAALTVGVCAVCYVAVWFGLALSPLLFNRNHSSPQLSGRTGSTNRIGELLSGGKTFAYAFRYVLQSGPAETPAGGKLDTNLLTLAEWWPSNFPASTGSSNLSNYSRASRPKTNDDG